VNVLLLGGGGREHAIGWKLAQSVRCEALISCPGNPGLALLGEIVPEVDPNDPSAVVALAADRLIDLVVVGPEAPLAAGVADALRSAGVPVFGPSAEGAMLEASKSFAKDVMHKASIPTAAADTFHNAARAKEHLARTDGPYVVKADGLASGKGVLVTPSLEAAAAWVDECLTGRFSRAEASVVIEEWMMGDEVSVFFICANGVAVALEPARDYKRLNDGDVGPNTGGMGSFSPVDDLDPGLVAWTKRAVAEPTLAELANRGIDYTGFLYVGLMLTPTGPRVVEFNVRLGDPETQAIMPRLDSDLLAILRDGATGNLGPVELRWNDTAVVNVVLAADGYPDDPKTGVEIDPLEDPMPGTLIFHAGTKLHNGTLATAGGRVLNVVGTGSTIAAARAMAYAQAATITFAGKQFRTDIGA
jgi:phosphoribosylamine--glycine ligase